MCKKSSPADGRAMNSDAAAIHVGPRVGQWLRDTAYPGPNKLKRLMRDLGAAEGTGKDWLAGKRPSQEWLDCMAAKWGWRFLAFIYAPVCGNAPLDARLDAVEREIMALRRDMEAERGLDHRNRGGADAEISHLARGGECAQGPVLAGRQGALEVAAADAIDDALPARPADRRRA